MGAFLPYIACVTLPLLYSTERATCTPLCASRLLFPPRALVDTGTIGKFGRGLSAFAGEGGGRLFAQLAVLGGCDYVDNVRGLGLLSVLPIVARFKSIQADRRVSRILMHIHKMGKTVRVRHITK